MSIAYDSYDGYIVLFGGYDGSNVTSFDDTWVFGLAQITVSVTPASAGTVTLNGTTYENGSSLTLPFGSYSITHSASPWWSFDGWTSSGDVAVDPLTAQVSVDGNGTVTAPFRAVALLQVLTLPDCPPVSFNGTSVAANASFRVLAGSTFPLVAAPCPSRLFLGWNTSGGASVAAPNATNTTVTVAANGTVVAGYGGAVTFVVTPAGDGAISVNGTTFRNSSAAVLPVGRYPLAAVAFPWARFTSWSWSPGSLGMTPGTLWVNASGELTAHFALFPWVGVKVDPSGCGPVSWNGTPEGSGTGARWSRGSYPVVAPSCPGFAFHRWTASGNLTVLTPDRPNATADVRGNGTLVATYVPLFEVTFGVAPTGAGTVRRNGTDYPGGASVTVPGGNYTIAALPDPGESFAYWTYNATLSIANGTANVTGNGTVTAYFGAVGHAPRGGTGGPSPLPWLEIGGLVTIGAAAAVGIAIVYRRRDRSQRGSSGPQAQS